MSVAVKIRMDFTQFDCFPHFPAIVGRCFDGTISLARTVYFRRPYYLASPEVFSHLRVSVEAHSGYSAEGGDMKPDLVRRQAHQAIQWRLGHKLVRIELLQQALTHRSFDARNNECFEFVGDAILNYSIAKMLFDAFPKLTEGELSRLRANLVNERVLAETVLEMSIGDGLYLGAGELKSGGFKRPPILVDAMEAMFAAVSFDAGLTAAGEAMYHLFAERVKRVDFKNQGKDNKTVLQEALRARYLSLPKYHTEKQVGDVKDSRFVVSCDSGKLGFICRAQETNHEAAKQEVAVKALIWLERQLPSKRNKK